MSRIGPGDALIGLAVLTLVFAALLPAYRARAFDRLVAEARTDVETLRDAMVEARDAEGDWPRAAPPGRLPEGSVFAFAGDTALVRQGYALEWRLWRRVEEVPAPPGPPAAPVVDADEAPPAVLVPGDAPPDSVGPELIPVVRVGGAVVVHSGSERLLAELLRQYGDASFVRDTTWTLIVTDEVPGGV